MTGGGNRCRVAICKSYSSRANVLGEHIGFFNFPKDPKIRKLWIQKCYRRGKWNANSGKVCSKHFTKDDFEDALMAEFLGVYPKRLKKTAVPSLHLLPEKEERTPKRRPSKYLERKHRKELVDTLIANYSLEVEKQKQTRIDTVKIADLRQDEMFHIVRFESDVVKEKTVVPSIWLNKNDALCLLPPVATATDIETLALLRAQPTEGWRMYKVSSLKTFDTYVQAKESLENMKRPAAPDPQADATQKRKMRRPTHFEQYVISDDPDEAEEPGIMVPDTASEGNSTQVDPFIVKLESISNSSRECPLTSTPSIIDFAPLYDESTNTRGTKTPDDNSQLQVVCRDEATPRGAICPCNSTCHKMILQSLGRMEEQVATNTRLLRQLLGHPIRSTEVTSHSLPNDLPLTLPAMSIKEVEEFDTYLQYDANYAQALAYFLDVGGNDARQTMRRVLEKIVSADLALQMNWKGRGEKKPFGIYTRIHNLIFNAVKQNPRSETVTLSDVERYIKDWLRFAPDRQGNRQKRRQEMEEKMLRC